MGQPSAKRMRPVPHFRKFKLIAKETIVEESLSPVVLPVRMLTFELPPGKRLGLDLGTGEYVKVWVPGSPKPKPYSPTSDPERDGSFDLTIKVYPGGIVSGALDKLSVGGHARISGPFPPRVFRKRRLPGRHVCIICQGIGITECYRVARAELERGDAETVALLYANRYANDSLFTAELTALKEKHGVKFRLQRIYSGEEHPDSLQGRVDSACISSVFDLPCETEDSNASVRDEKRFLVVGNKPFKGNMWGQLEGLGFSRDTHSLLVKGMKERVPPA
jgi:cytochrome-b5 reductase